MESLPQNPEFRINPENFQPCNNEIYSLLSNDISIANLNIQCSTL